MAFPANNFSFKDDERSEGSLEVPFLQLGKYLQQILHRQTDGHY